MSLAEATRLYVDRVNKGQPTSIQDLSEALDLPEDELVKFFNYPPVTKILKEQHDLPPPPKRLSKRSLTTQQKRWILACTNPYTAKPVGLLAVEFGIDLTTHRRWMKQPAFRDAYNAALKEDLTVAQGEMARKAANRALQGDPKSIEIFHRLAGKPLAALQESSSAGAVPIQELITILQRALPSDLVAKVASEILNPTEPKALPEALENE